MGAGQADKKKQVEHQKTERHRWRESPLSYGKAMTLGGKEEKLVRQVAANRDAFNRVVEATKKGRMRDLWAGACRTLASIVLIGVYIGTIYLLGNLPKTKPPDGREVNYALDASLLLVGVGITVLLGVVGMFLGRRLVAYRVAASAMLVVTQLRWTIECDGDWRYRQRTVRSLDLLSRRFRGLYSVTGMRGRCHMMGASRGPEVVHEVSTT